MAQLTMKRLLLLLLLILAGAQLARAQYKLDSYYRPDNGVWDSGKPGELFTPSISGVDVNGTSIAPGAYGITINIYKLNYPSFTRGTPITATFGITINADHSVTKGGCSRTGGDGLPIAGSYDDRYEVEVAGNNFPAGTTVNIPMMTVTENVLIQYSPYAVNSPPPPHLFSFTGNIGPVVRPVMGLKLHVVNQDNKGAAIELYNAAGAKVLLAGLGANSTGDFSYDPGSSPAVGRWVAGYGVSHAGSGSYDLVGVVGNTLELSTGADASTWLYDWTARDTSGTHGLINITIPPGGTGNGFDPSTGAPNSGGSAGSNGTITNNTGSAMNLHWVDATGATVGTGITIPAGGSYTLGPGDVPAPSGPAGSSSQYTLVDGSGAPLGNVVTTVIDGKTVVTGSINATANPPAGTQTPTTTQNNEGNSSTGTTSSGGSTGSGSGGTTQTPPTTHVNNGASTTITNQDVYNDVRSADIDAGRSTRSANLAGSVNPGAQPSAINGTDAADMSTSVGNAVSGINTARAGIVSKVAGITPLSVPTSLGTNYTFDSNLPVLGTVHVDYSSYSSTISAFRVVCLFVLGIIIWFAAIRIIRSGVA